VRLADADWDRARYAGAARLLGRLAARMTRSEARLPPSFSRTPGEVLRLHFLERELFGLPVLRSDAVWNHPLVADAADPALRADLRDLAERAPALLDALDTLPQRYVHGDASPQNLLVPAEEPDGFVAIDWSLIGPAAVGFDLSQLLVGRVHTGRLPAAALGALLDTVVAAYAAGLAEEDDPVPAETVRQGAVGSLVVRSAFSALPLAALADPPRPALAALVAERVRLTRHLVDLATP
jgi:Ser/Thr protein kinase RdoA (MazF antagonist)